MYNNTNAAANQNGNQGENRNAFPSKFTICRAVNDKNGQLYVHVSMEATFCQLLTETKRPGIPKLLEWLENSTDFYTAPASTRYHLCCEGGLLIHSLNVYSRLVRLRGVERTLYDDMGVYFMQTDNSTDLYLQSI